MITGRVRFEILKRDGFRCLYCGRTPPEVELHVDHLIARKRGGGDEVGNLVTSCAECNLGKSDKGLEVRLPSLEEKQQKQKESAEQLRQYAAWCRARIESEDESCRVLSEHWVKLAGRNPKKWEMGQKFQVTFRHFLKRLPLPEIIEAIEIAFRKELTDWHRFKYFCGICWKKVRDRKAACVEEGK